MIYLVLYFANEHPGPYLRSVFTNFNDQELDDHFDKIVEMKKTVDLRIYSDLSLKVIKKDLANNSNNNNNSIYEEILGYNSASSFAVKEQKRTKMITDGNGRILTEYTTFILINY